MKLAPGQRILDQLEGATINDVDLCKWRSAMREAYGTLDHLTAEGKADALWIAYHRISNAAEKAKARLNELKYAKGKP